MHLLSPGSTRRGLSVAAAAALLATALTPLASASATTGSATTVLTLSSSTTTGVPAAVAPGYHTFILKQSAAQAKKDPRGVTIEHFAKGYTTKQFGHDLASSFGDKPNLKAYARIIKNVKALGGLELESDFTTTADRFTVLLTPGTYVVDNGATNEGAPDNFKTLVVKGTAVGAKPATLGTVTSKEFAFKLTNVHKGKHLYALHDAGAQIHMYSFNRIDKGHTLAEIEQALQSDGPPPAWVHPGGFAGVVSGGQTMYTTLNFSPNSEYLLVCFMPDVKTGIPHAALGMVRVFTVK